MRSVSARDIHLPFSLISVFWCLCELHCIGLRCCALLCLASRRDLSVQLRLHAMESLLCYSPKVLPLTPAQPWRTRTPRACPASARSQVHFLATSATTSTSPIWTSRTRCLNFARTPLPSGTRCQAAADQSEEPLTVDNSTVLVVGGGGVGMETVRALAKAGSWVTAYQRGEKFRKEIEGLGSMLALGDVLDVATIEKVLRSNSFDAIVCTVGGGTTQPNVDKDGPINLVNAAKKAGVKRIIMISSIGAGDSVKAVDDRTLAVLKTVLEAKEVAEEAVKSSGLDYTIIRPGGLLAAPPSGNGILTENSGIAGLISRGDVATLIMKVLFNEKSYQKILSAIDQDKLLPPTTSLDGVELLTL